MKRTIKELHGDLFEEGTELKIADTFGDDPDAIWISKIDFVILGARPIDMLSRTFFLYYKGDERKRIACVDHDLLHGQVKLNMQDYGDFVAKDDAYTLNLFRPYRILLEQYLIFEKFGENKVTGLLMATARKFFRKLLLFYCSIYVQINEIDMSDYVLLNQSNLYWDLYEMGIVKLEDGRSNIQKSMVIMHTVESLYMLYETLNEYPPSLALPMKLPYMSYADLVEFLEAQEYIRKKGHANSIPKRFIDILKIWEGTTIPFIDYMHWDEVRKQRKQMKADNETIMRQLDLIIAIWRDEVVPIMQEREQC